MRDTFTTTVDAAAAYARHHDDPRGHDQADAGPDPAAELANDGPARGRTHPDWLTLPASGLDPEEPF